MSGMYQVAMGDRGRLVVPAALRTSAGLVEGLPLVLLETERGIVLLTREQLKRAVRDDLQGLRLVDDLLALRRRDADDEDAA